MNFKNAWKRGAVALGLATMAGACGSGSSAAAPASAAKPALWQVTDRDTTIYLFGTIHLLPDNTVWRSPKFDKALAKSNGLVVETIIDEKNLAPFAGLFTRLAVRSDLPPLVMRVPPDKRGLLLQAIRNGGAVPASLDRMETWAAAFQLINLQFRGIGLKQQQGVDQVLKSNFAAAGKPVGQLETNAEQLGVFDTLPESAQQALLIAALDRPEQVKAQFDGMLGAWMRGDVDTIARTFNSDMAATPALTDALLTRRNANWARWIEGRMAQPGTVMVAVGAGHLAGPASVQAMLGQRGLEVTRLQ